MPDTPPVNDALAHQLARSESRCRALLEATDAIVWSSDPQQGFVEPQASWQTYTGHDWETHRGTGWLKAVHPEDRAAVMEAWSRATAQGHPHRVNCRLWHADSRAWRQCVVRATPIQDAAGRTVEWVGAVTDVHDRPMTLEDLHRLNEALKAQLEVQAQELDRLFSLSLDVLLSLGEDGRLISVSPSFSAVTGVPHTEAVGEVFERFLHPEDVPRTWNEIRRVLTGAHVAVDFETRLLPREGEPRVVAWRAVGVPQLRRLYAVGRDVTEQKRAQARLVRAQRLEAVGQLTGGIAHDFNNILASVLTYLQVARRKTADPGLKTLLTSGIEAGRRGAALVAQLLSFARKQELAIEPVDLNATIDGMHDLISRTLGGNVAVRRELHPGLFPVQADRTQLELVLLNLAINARDAMPEGGEIVLRSSARHITADTATRVDDLPMGEYGVLQVIDHGIGMDEGTLARCLEPFFTTKGAQRGTGLGLAQVLGVVQQCGGNLQVESAAGRGTTVTVLLPRAHGAPQVPSDAAPVSAHPPTFSRARVLVVDDDPDVLQSTAALLAELGYDAQVASSPEQAMELVLSGTPIEVMVADYAMGGLNGVQLLRDAMQHRPRLVGLLVTGHVDLTGLHHQLPGVAMLRKPFEPDQLAEAIDAALRLHRVNTGET